MVSVESRVNINRSVSAVFGYLAQPTNWPQWLDGILEATAEGAGSLGEGSRVHLVIKFLGRRFETTAHATEYRQDDRIGMQVQSGPFPMAWMHRVEEANGGTLVTTSLDADPGRFFSPAGPLLRGLLQRHFDDDHATLKVLLELPSMAPVGPEGE
jgi:polyketide cyclase/dehydrase/lipid transport protein